MYWRYDTDLRERLLVFLFFLLLLSARILRFDDEQTIPWESEKDQAGTFAEGRKCPPVKQPNIQLPLLLKGGFVILWTTTISALMQLNVSFFFNFLVPVGIWPCWKGSLVMFVFFFFLFSCFSQSAPVFLFRRFWFPGTSCSSRDFTFSLGYINLPLTFRNCHCNWARAQGYFRYFDAVMGFLCDQSGARKLGI